MVAFIVFWPLGLALLVWSLWRDQIKSHPMVQKWRDVPHPERPAFLSRPLGRRMGPRPSNAALAAYLAQEQARLQAEQDKLAELVRAFEAFKAAEQRAADERDFESFLKQQAAESPSAGPASSEAS